MQLLLSILPHASLSPHPIPHPPRCLSGEPFLHLEMMLRTVYVISAMAIPLGWALLRHHATVKRRPFAADPR
jgi:hypothetical protein